MSRVRLLTEQVANQIAAGEVVERPASVVKELVENALDAGASEISVEVQAGGRAMVRVSDNGVGMSQDDALLALERHATSKIEDATDLAKVSTMGFRGEALPSIASVSRFVLTTRERDSDSAEATQVIINGGKIAQVKAAGRDPGTTIEVRQIFFNVPARRKFLRTEETERAHIQHYLILVALAYPGVTLTFRQNQRTVWHLPSISIGDGNSEIQSAVLERWNAIHGGETRLIPLSQEVHLDPPMIAEDGEEQEEPQSNTYRIWGVIGAPGVSRSSRENHYLFVNLRPVEHQGLNRALLEGYHTSLMKGRFPVCCLFLEVDPQVVDVNVHPAKREVRFHQDRAIRKFVASSVRRTLEDYHRSSEPRENPVPLPLGRREPSPESSDEPGIEIRPPESRVEYQSPQSAESRHPSVDASAGGETKDSTKTTNRVSTSVEGEPVQEAAPIASEVDRTEPSPSTAELDLQLSKKPVSIDSSSADFKPLGDVSLRILGVVGKLYVILESDRGMVMMDQHAAHERILFEQMMERMESGAIPTQRLLLPETVELSPRDTSFLKTLVDTLNRLGVGIREFGERTFLLDSLPPFVKAPNASAYCLDLIDELKAAGDSVNSMRLGESVVAKTVCRHAVKANDDLRGPELETLLEDLRQCRMPYTCPHGRPTLIEMSYRELEKKFGRSQ
jgi:DNA mismatch repair protein MutL